jgi:hypothetical protein
LIFTLSRLSSESRQSVRKPLANSFFDACPLLFQMLAATMGYSSQGDGHTGKNEPHG